LVTLYRAVAQEELDDIARIGGFRGKGEGSYESKLFATSVVDAAAFGRAFHRLDGKPFTIVEVRIPRALADSLYHGTADGRAIIAVDVEQLADFNAAVAVRELPDAPLSRWQSGDPA
jgi:hypothetical protein